MEEKSKDEKNNINNINNKNNINKEKNYKLETDEKKKIISNIVKKVIQSSKSTQKLTSEIINCLITKDKEKIIYYCENGLPDDLPQLRSLIWKINLGYLPPDIEKWDKTLKSKRISYQNYKNYVFKKLEEELELFKDYGKMSKKEKKELDKKTSKPILEDICKDTNRTHTEMSFFIRPIDKNNTFSEEEILKLIENRRNCTLKNINDIYKINIVLTHSDLISRILFIHCKFEPMISYVQGMNEILSTIYYCFSFDRDNDDEPNDDVEADSFWAFYFLMQNLKSLFDKHEDTSDTGVSGKVKRLKEMLKILDNKLYVYLENIGFNYSIIGFKWISLMFSQEYEMMDLLRLWDYLLCHENKFQNCYYFCLSIILMKKEKIMKSKVTEVYEIFQDIQDLELENIISNAKYISNKSGKKCLEIMEKDYDLD